MRVLAKFLICSRTTSMPRSSDALSCAVRRRAGSTTVRRSREREREMRAHLEAVVAHDALVVVDLARDGEDGRRLARARRAVEEEVRHPVLGDELVDCGRRETGSARARAREAEGRRMRERSATGGDDVLVGDDVVEGGWAVLLDPRQGVCERGEGVRDALEWGGDEAEGGGACR